MTQRDRKPGHDEFGHREIAILKRRTEIALHDSEQVAAELLVQRLIEMIGRAQIRL